MLIDLRFGAQADVQELVALENLGTVCALGYHLLSGEREGLERLSELPGLSPRARAAYRRAAVGWTQIRGLALRAKRRLLVSHDVTHVQADGQGWKIPLKEFRHGSLLSRPEILAENLEDARFYRGLAEAYGSGKLSVGFPVSLSARGAGGSTMPNELNQRLVDGPLFVICVADSDKKWSGGAAGSVFAACRLKLPHDTWVAELRGNGVKTIENLLLHGWLEKTDFNTRNRHLVRAIGALEGLTCQELRYHGDLKSVHGLCFYRSHPELEAQHAYRAAIDELEPTSPCGPECGGSCFKFGGIHSAVTAVADLLAAKAKMCGRSISGSRPHEELGEALFEFGMGWAPIRA